MGEKLRKDPVLEAARKYGEGSPEHLAAIRNLTPEDIEYAIVHGFDES